MNHKLIYILLISLFSGISQAQKKDTISISPQHFFIGIDAANPIAGFFSDKKNYNGYLTFQIRNRWVIAAEFGFEKNIYKKNEWNVNAKGGFATVGFNYIISNNYEKSGEGFFTGARIGFSPFKQEIKEYPIKTKNLEGQTQVVGKQSLPEANVSSGWIEAVLGAKAQIGNSPFYIDLIVKPKFIVFSKKQNSIDNLVVPGYGKDKGNVNLSFIWGISYRIF